MGTNGVTFDAGSPLHNLKDLRKQQKKSWQASQKALDYVNANQAKGVTAREINQMVGIGRARSYNQVQAYAKDFEQALAKRDALAYVNANQAKGVTAREINQMVGIGRARSYNQVQAYAKDLEKVLEQKENVPVALNTKADLNERFKAEVSRLAGSNNQTANKAAGANILRLNTNNAEIKPANVLQIGTGSKNLPVKVSQLRAGNVIDVEAIEVKPSKFSKILKNLKGKGKYAAVAAALVGAGIGLGALFGDKKDEKVEEKDLLADKAKATKEVDDPMLMGPPKPENLEPKPEEKTETPVEEKPIDTKTLEEEFPIREVGPDEDIKVLDKDAEVKLLTLEDLYAEIPAYTFPPRYMTQPKYAPSPVENFNFTPVTTDIQTQIAQNKTDRKALQQELKAMKKVERLQKQIIRKTDRYNIREMRDAARDEMRNVYQTTELGVAEYKANRAIQQAFYN